MRLLNAGLSTFDYVERTLWPTDLAVLYPLSRSVTSTRLLVSFAFVAVASIFAWRSMRSRPWAFVGWFWFLGMLVPVIGIVQVGVQAPADRYMYLPLIGLSIVAAWGARDALRAAPRR